MYDIFFISYKEMNAEENWLRLKMIHSESKRLHGIRGIDIAHITCNQLATTDFFWTVDGDNWLTKPLIYENNIEADLLLFQTVDALFPNEYTSLGSVKLWRKDSFINKDMRYGDFSLNATSSRKVCDECYSKSSYNASPFDCWKTSFRHCVKLMSVILQTTRTSENINIYLNRWKKTLNSKEANSEWAYRGFKDAENYVANCNDNMNELNKINDYNWLEQQFFRMYRI